MIHAQEIRIGNCVKDKHGKIRFITHRILSDIASAPKNHGYEPIPLTAELLIQMGFKEGKSFETGKRTFNLKDFTQLADYGTQEIILLNEGFAYLSCGYYENQIDCPYVHSLQNLYFVLTGDELTIKELQP